jgi:hypothetical protein
VVRFIAFILACLVPVIATAADPQTQTATPPTTQKDYVAEMEKYFAQLYAKPLREKPRLPKLVALMSLSKLDAPATTSQLIEAAGSSDPVVAYLAWEILHARQDRLTADYHAYWIKRGLELGAAGTLPPASLVSALQAAESVPYDTVASVSGKLFDTITASYDPAVESDVPVLTAAGKLLAAWQAAPLLQRVARQMSDAKRSAAAERILMGLPGAPAPDAPADQKKSALNKLAKTPGEPKLHPYTAVGKVVPAPVKIVDPKDPQWYKELELSDLAISNFELVWVIDSTGSMNEWNQIIAANAAPVMRMLDLVSEQTRVGAVYYRHEVDAKLQVECCRQAANAPWYQTKPHPLNRNAEALAAAMAAEPIPKPDKTLHNMHPGSAVHGGLVTAIGKLDWTRDAKSRRVIVLVGDATLTAGTEQATAALAAEAVKNGFQVHALTVGKRAYESFHPVVEAAKGLHWDFVGDKPAHRRNPAAGDHQTINDFDVIARLVIKSSINKAYHDRIDPLLDALAPLIEQRKR